ncbi:serine serine/threonine-protein phosphatase 2A regulatory subunit B subunit beta [Sigmodon hispidus]
MTTRVRPPAISSRMIDRTFSEGHDQRSSRAQGQEDELCRLRVVPHIRGGQDHVHQCESVSRVLIRVSECESVSHVRISVVSVNPCHVCESVSCEPESMSQVRIRVASANLCPVSTIEYWFCLMDLDGDSVLSMFKLKFFYEEQMRRLDTCGIEPLPFCDCVCQMLDLVVPRMPGEPHTRVHAVSRVQCLPTGVPQGGSR